jgi:hypothetical protein
VVDKSSQMVLTALSKAAAEPSGLPLHGRRGSPGLFPPTASGKLAAQRCQDEGLLQRVPPFVDAARNGESWCVTERGLGHLLGQLSPRQVLEDLVRAVEARQAQADELLTIARRLYVNLDSLKAGVEKVLPLVAGAGRNGDGPLADLFRSFATVAPPPASPDDALMLHLERWQQSGASEDCPLPELFRRVSSDVPGLSLGAFHDALRRLHDAGRLYLHPWAGPLYDLPEPPCALLVGHVVAYYASSRNGAAAASA